MDRGSSISIKTVARNLDLDAFYIELGTQMILIFLLLHLLGRAEESSLNGQTPVSDNACTGEFAAEIRVGGPGLELVVGVAELFGSSVTGTSVVVNRDSKRKRLHNFVCPVSDIGEVLVDLDGDRSDDTERSSGSPNGLPVSILRAQLQRTSPITTNQLTQNRSACCGWSFVIPFRYCPFAMICRVSIHKASARRHTISNEMI